MTAVYSKRFIEEQLVHELPGALNVEEQEILERTIEHHSKSFCPDFFYRIWQAVLSIFGASDWQCSVLILENNKIEDPERLLYTGINYCKHGDNATQRLHEIISAGKPALWYLKDTANQLNHEGTKLLERTFNSYRKVTDDYLNRVETFATSTLNRLKDRINIIFS